jgi:hypothetical protein
MGSSALTTDWIGMAKTHDPEYESSKLRDHLSAPDRPTIFLIGAGASASVRGTDRMVLIPAVIALTEQCRIKAASLGAWAEQVWDGTVKNLAAGTRPTSQITIEDILSSLRDKISAMSAGDTSLGATVDQLKDLESIITREIVDAANPSADRVPDTLPHDSLARWIARGARSTAVEIFTTNYDTLIEKALERERLPIFDGFVGSETPFFLASSMSHASMAPGKDWTRLWKIHGSINWKLEKDDSRGSRIVRALPGVDAHMILPSSQKYDESRKLPYIAMLDRLSKSLVDRVDPILVVIGYSFGDQHINEILLDALEAQPRMHLVALQYSDPVPGDALWNIATKFSNVLAYGPDIAIIGGTPGAWQLVEEVAERTAPRIDPVFDSDAVVEKDAPALSGKFRLGDFNWLALFLDEIASNRG